MTDDREKRVAQILARAERSDAICKDIANKFLAAQADAGMGIEQAFVSLRPGFILTATAFFRGTTDQLEDLDEEKLGHFLDEEAEAYADEMKHKGTAVIILPATLVDEEYDGDYDRYYLAN